MTRQTRTRLPGGASLDQQIRAVEQRLLRRRASSSVRLTLLRSQLRESMTSPLALLLAAGTGFAMGPSKEPSSAQSSTSASPGDAASRFLPTMVSMISLAGSVMTLVGRFQTHSASAKAANVSERTEYSPPGGHGSPHSAKA